MLKEQIFQIVDGANFKQGQTSKEATDTILNLFKAEVDKLTVKIIDKPHCVHQGDCPVVIKQANDGLQHTKKQLLEGLEG